MPSVFVTFPAHTLVTAIVGEDADRRETTYNVTQKKAGKNHARRMRFGDLGFSTEDGLAARGDEFGKSAMPARSEARGLARVPSGQPGEVLPNRSRAALPCLRAGELSESLDPEPAPFAAGGKPNPEM